MSFAVYDVTNPASLENLASKWMRDFKEYGRQDAVQMVVGNKIDLVSIWRSRCVQSLGVDCWLDPGVWGDGWVGCFADGGGGNIVE